MIKLIQLLFEVNEATQNRIDAINEIYQEEIDQAEMLGRPKPTPPKPEKLKDTDYDKTESILYIDCGQVLSISSNIEGDTQILTKDIAAFLVKETPDEVYQKMVEAKKLT